MFIFINKHNESEELGTDFYNSDLKKVKTLPYKDNYGYFFLVAKIHGMEWKKRNNKGEKVSSSELCDFQTDWKVSNFYIVSNIYFS